jgi:hypothetical protein
METITFEWEDSHYRTGFRGTGNYIKSAHVQIEQLNATITVQYDWDHNFTDGRGTFTSKWKSGAIKNPRAKYDRSVFEYFVPDYTVAEQLRDSLKMGETIQAARKDVVRIIKEDMAIAADPESQGYIAVGVIATVYYKGVELATSSIWGTELDDSDDPCIDEIANDALYDALRDAGKKLAELRESVN